MLSLAAAVATIVAAGCLAPAIVGMTMAAAFVGDALGPTDGVGLVPESLGGGGTVEVDSISPTGTGGLAIVP